MLSPRLDQSVYSADYELAQHVRAARNLHLMGDFPAAQIKYSAGAPARSHLLRRSCWTCPAALLPKATREGS